MALGLLQVLGAVWLVLVELAQPTPDGDFAGIAFSNAITSPRARAATDLFRERLHWPGDEAADVPRSLSPTAYLWSKRAGVVALTLLQVTALLVCVRNRQGAVAKPVWPWLAGPTLSLGVLILAPPVSTDVFYYAAAGNLAANRVNPYIVAPSEVAAGDPFAPFNDWAHIASPYGPVWTHIARLVGDVTGPDPFWAAIGLKAVAAGSVIGLALVTAALGRRLTDRPQLACATVVLVAWQPVLLLESAVSAHLDATMMLLAVGGLAAIGSGKPGTVRGGIALIAAGALIKPVVATLLPLAVLWRLAEARSESVSGATVVRRVVADAGAVVAVVGLAFAPFWSGGALPRVLAGESKRLYLDEALGVNAFWFWLVPRLPLIPSGDPWLAFTDRIVKPGTALLTLGALTASWCWLLARSWAWPAGRPARASGQRGIALRGQVFAWAIVTSALGFVPVNAHAWYVIWPLAPVALAWVAIRSRESVTNERTDPGGGRPWFGSEVSWWLWLFVIWSVGSFLVYHTHILAETPSP